MATKIGTKGLGITSISVKPEDCCFDDEGVIVAIDIKNEVILMAAKDIREKLESYC